MDLNTFVGEHSARKQKYLRAIVGLNPDGEKTIVYVDVYDVCEAFNPINEPLVHLIKKALVCGSRGHKDVLTDLTDIMASAVEAIRIEENRELLRKSGKGKC